MSPRLALLAFIAAAAPADVAAFPWYAKADDSAASSEPPSAEAKSETGGETPPQGAPHGAADFGGLALPGNLRLHGRFDINYERVGYSDNFFRGQDALQNYHRLLFLTRDVKDEPFSFNLEIIGQTWYEIIYRKSVLDGRVRIRARVGRILVPFGPDPLYHHAYGGRAGFDQQILPVIWSQHGGTVNVQTQVGPLLVADDVYAVQGYALSRADAVINLQSDFSSARDVRFGFGNRLSVSYAPFTVYYSAYYNALGFGRRLFMQAVDVSIWRFYGVPVLDRLTIDLGFLRADVSGGKERGYGGAGDDYYHLASYLQLRYYALDWLYIQARTGVKLLDNRRGFLGDDTRYDVRDTTSHNLGIVARYRNLTGAIYHFWNLEKRDEVDDDVLRFQVVYEF